MIGLEELVSAWRANPDARSTISLAQALARSGREDWIRELGQHAQTWHASRADVLIAVGQMYQGAQLLTDAQAALVLAGKAGGRDPRPFFLLGQVLLARGDAARAEKVLHRAIELGYRSNDALAWHHRAAGFVALQQAQGIQAVAAAVKAAEPIEPTPPMPPAGLRVPLPSTAGVNVGANASSIGQRLSPTSIPGRASPPRITPPEIGVATSAPDSPRPARSSPLHGTPSPVNLGGASPSRTRPTPASGTRLDTLVSSGALETDASATAWQRVGSRERPARRAFLFVLVSLIVAGAVTAGYAEITKVRRHDAVAAIDARADRLVRSGLAQDLHQSVSLLDRAFELDPTNPATARLWLWQRVATLILDDKSDGLSEALERAQDAGLPDAETAVGRIAELVGAGDLAGAATLVSRWDPHAKNNAWFQLISAVVLEQSGDMRAIDRYRAALGLDPELVLARQMLARLQLLDDGTLSDSERKGLESQLGAGVEMRVFDELRWALASADSTTVPAELDPPSLERLAVPLRSAAYVVNATIDLAGGDRKHAARTIREGIAISRIPASLARLGELAIAAGDEGAAREALRRLQPFHEIYPEVHVLAARVALLAGRLDEAEAAVSGLSADVPHAALVDAIIAYENLAPNELEQALSAFRNQSGVEFGAAKLALGVLRGTSVPDLKQIEDLAQPKVAYGQLIGVDAALSSGNIELAERWTDSWKTEPNRSDAGAIAVGCAHRVRVSRIARYRGHVDQALTASAQALTCGRVPLNAWIERGLALFAAHDGAHLVDLVKRHDRALGSAVPFLRALADVAASQPRRAQVDVAGLPLPVSGSPVVLRVLAARALVAANDLRARAYLETLRADLGHEPDVAALLK